MEVLNVRVSRPSLYVYNWDNLNLSGVHVSCMHVESICRGVSMSCGIKHGGGGCIIINHVAGLSIDSVCFSVLWLPVRWLYTPGKTKKGELKMERERLEGGRLKTRRFLYSIYGASCPFPFLLFQDIFTSQCTSLSSTRFLAAAEHLISAGVSPRNIQSHGKEIVDMKYAFWISDATMKHEPIKHKNYLWCRKCVT